MTTPQTEPAATAWNPRYLIYCARHGHSGNPESMLTSDSARYPGGVMTGFILWIQEQWIAFSQEHNCRSVEQVRLRYGAECDAMFDAWIAERSAGSDQDCTQDCDCEHNCSCD